MRRPRLPRASNRDRQNRDTPRQREAKRSGLKRLEPTVERAPSFREDQDRFARIEEPNDCANGFCVGFAGVHRERMKVGNDLLEEGNLKEALPRHIMDRPSHRSAHEHRIRVRDVVWRDKEWALEGNIRDPLVSNSEVGPAREPGNGAHKRKEWLFHGPNDTWRLQPRQDAVRARAWRPADVLGSAGVAKPGRKHKVLNARERGRARCVRAPARRRKLGGAGVAKPRPKHKVLNARERGRA